METRRPLVDRQRGFCQKINSGLGYYPKVWNLSHVGWAAMLRTSITGKPFAATLRIVQQSRELSSVAPRSDFL